MNYTINYHTGAGNEIVNGTLEEAMKTADNGVAYIQENITIENENGCILAKRSWNGIAYDADEDAENNEFPQSNPIIFGQEGYYSDWEI